MSRVLVISNDYINRRMAGPAIRSLELARQLHGAGNTVTLASRADSDLPGQPFPLLKTDVETLQRIAPQHDVIVLQGHVLDSYPFLADSGSRMVVDLYGPFTLELLVLKPIEPAPNRLPLWEPMLGVANDQLRLGDFFLCASEKQFDYWVGALTALNRVNPDNYAKDPSMRSLIDLVPFGLPEEPPVKQGAAMRGVIPGIDDDDLILLGGSIYNWLDPLTLIEGVAIAKERHPNLRVVFMGTVHPNLDVPKFWMVNRARRLAEERGLLNKFVFFNEGWVPYERRADWLLEADVAVSTHTEHLEARYAFRTRFLDFFWAGLPILCTRGDTLGDAVETHGLGITVPPSDPQAIAQAIDRMADAEARRQYSQRVREYAPQFTWRKVAAPLVNYCANPWRAADLAAIAPYPVVPVPLGDHDAGSRGWRRLAVKAVTTAVYQGPVPLLQKGSTFIRRRVEARFAKKPPPRADAQPSLKPPT